MSRQNQRDRLFETYNIRTDLALESHQAVIEHEGPPELPGVQVHTEQEEGITLTRITAGVLQQHLLPKHGKVL